jgi:hypothetical protein
MLIAKSIFLPVRVHPAVKDELDTLKRTVKKSRGAVLTALVMQATIEDLPLSWRESADAERRLLEEADQWQAPSRP